MNDKFLKGSIFAVLGGACWGISGSIGQFMFQDLGMDSQWLVPLRLFLAGVIMLVYSAIRYKKETVAPWKTSKGAVRLLIYGIPGVALCQFFYFTTIQLSTAAIGTIMQDLAPIFIMLATCVIGRKSPRAVEIISVILGIIGVILLTTHGRFDGSQMSGMVLLFGVLSAVCVAVYNIALGRMLQRYPLPILQGWSFFLGGILLGIVFKPWTIDYTPNAIGILGIIGVVVIGNIMAFSFYISGVKYIGPERAVLFGFSEPIVAAIITVLFLGSSFTWVDAVGFIMIFVMLALNSLGGRKKGKTKTE